MHENGRHGGPASEAHRRARWLVALSLAMLATGARAGTPPPTDLPGDAYFTNHGWSVVRVASDHVGVAASDKATAAAIERLAAQYKLSFHGAYRDNLYLLGLAQPATRAGLLALARQLRLAGQKLGVLREAGLVMWTKAEEPELLTDELIVRFRDDVPESTIKQINAKLAVTVVRPDRYVKHQYLLSVTAQSPGDALAVARIYQGLAETRFAHPNYWVTYETFESVPAEPLFGEQWHHRNIGQSGGLADADADTSWAWDFGFGSSSVLIAVQDGGIEREHEDLTANIFVNAGEIPGDGIDNDGNGFVDDVSGWDFNGGDNDPSPASAGDNHGTAVSGSAAAPVNGLGVAGSCPGCRILPIRLCCTNSVQAYADAFGYSDAMGARVINNSWGHTSPAAVVPAVVENAINAAAADDVAIFFAAGNGNTAGWCGASYPSLDAVVAVSSATNQDIKVTEAAFGDCVDVLAPSHRGYSEPYNGTLNITTTDRTGAAGYNNASPPPLFCPIAEPGDQAYTSCFGGTSFASPLTAGVAGLLRSADGTLTRVDVQRLIEDTADKIMPSVASYGDTTGYSHPGGVATYAFGRLNAFEAVRVAASSGVGGRGGVDVFLRDNVLDWGNTSGYLGEQASNVRFESPRGFVAHWESVDIKVDAPPFGPVPTTSQQFDALVHENPSSGVENRVFVRAHNRGPHVAGDVVVKAHWAYAGAGLPALPADFWTAFPADAADTTQVHPIGTVHLTSLGYSGASVAGTPSDLAQIAVFTFTPPAPDPALPNHYCMFAVADSVDDPVDPESRARFVIDAVTPNDNNVTHRNMRFEDTGGTSFFRERFFVRNPYREPIVSRLRFVDPRVAEGFKASVRGVVIDAPFRMKPGEERLVELALSAPRPGAEASIRLVQDRLDTALDPEVLGGMTYQLGPQQKPRQ